MQQQITFALLSGDLDGVMTALHGSEVHRKIFSMAAEAIEGTMEDLSDGTPGQKGYVIGRIVFEVGTMVFPAAKAGLLAKLSKVEVFNHLMTKGRLIGAKARQFMTAVRTPLMTTRMCFVAGTMVKAKEGLVKIEEVQPGMEVWSRDEFTQQEGWKPVVQTFITHPAELHHLTYELRGPPERGPLSPSVASETLGVTAPHPFWVSNRSQPGFVPAGELRAGDELRLANGGRAIVTANTPETAPLGETFTTYNFEVADFHTYFAGRGEVWVHNDGVGECDRILAAYRYLRSNRGMSPWDAFVTLEKKLPNASSQALHKAAAECMQEILSSGQKLPSYREIAKVNGGHYVSWKSLGTRADDVFKDVLGEIDVQDAAGHWMRIKLEVHHGVPKAIQQFLEIPKSEWDKTPAFLTTMLNHRVGLESLHGRMAAKGIDLKNLSAWKGKEEKLLEAIESAYTEAGLSDLWGQCRTFLQNSMP